MYRVVKRVIPCFNFAITSVNVADFDHFHCYNKKWMTCNSKISPATSPWRWQCECQWFKRVNATLQNWRITIIENWQHCNRYKYTANINSTCRVDWSSVITIKIPIYNINTTWHWHRMDVLKKTSNFIFIGVKMGRLFVTIHTWRFQSSC